MEGTIKFLRFTKRDIPIPADYRPMYKIGHIVLILSICCRAGKSSLMKLHFLCWAIKTKTNIYTVKKWIGDGFSNEFHVWGVEPTVNRALTFAVADGLIINTGAHFIITEKGTSLFKIINGDGELYFNEKKILNEIGKNVITEQRINELSNKFF